MKSFRMFRQQKVMNIYLYHAGQNEQTSVIIKQRYHRPDRAKTNRQVRKQTRDVLVLLQYIPPQKRVCSVEIQPLEGVV